MKMAEVYSDEEDIFSSSMQKPLIVKLSDNNETTFEAHFSEKAINSEIDSDDEIDAFIKSSQSPTRSFLPTNITVNQKQGRICCTAVKNNGFEGVSDLSTLSEDFTQSSQDLGPLSLAMPATQDFDAEIPEAKEDYSFSQDIYQLSLELPSTQNFDLQMRRAVESNKKYAQKMSFQGATLECKTYPQDKTDLFHSKLMNETLDLSVNSYDDTNSDHIEKNLAKSTKSHKKVEQDILCNDSYMDSNIELNLPHNQCSIRSASTSSNHSISSCETEPYEVFESQNKKSLSLEIENKKILSQEMKQSNTASFKMTRGFCTEPNKSSLSREAKVAHFNVDEDFIKKKYGNECSSKPTFQLHQCSGPNSPSLLQEDSDDTYNKPFLNYLSSNEDTNKFENDSTDSNLEVRELSEPNSPSLLQMEDLPQKADSAQKSYEVTACNKGYLVEYSQPHCCIGSSSPSLLEENYSDKACKNCIISEDNDNTTCADETTQLNISGATPTDTNNVSTEVKNPTKVNSSTNKLLIAEESTQIKIIDENKLPTDCEDYSAGSVEFDALTQISITDKSAVRVKYCLTNCRSGMSDDDVDFEACTQVMTVVKGKLKNIDKNIAINNSSDIVDNYEATQGMAVTEVDDLGSDTDIDFGVATQVCSTSVKLAIPTDKTDFDGVAVAVAATQVTPIIVTSKCDFDFKALTQEVPIVEANCNPANDVEVDFERATQQMINEKNVTPCIQLNKRNNDGVAYKVPTQVVPIVKASPAKINKVDFEGATQVLPATPIKLNTPASKTYFDNTDFKAPTDVVPIVKEKSVNVSECDFARSAAKEVMPLVGDTEGESDFDDVDFEVVTQVTPSIRSVAKEVMPLVDDTEGQSDFDDVDFEVVTQVTPSIRTVAKEVMPLVDDTEGQSDFDDVDFEVATQVIPSIQLNKRNKDEVNFKVPTQLVPIVKANPAKIIEVDFVGAKQATPIVAHLEVKSDFDEVDFEVATQVLSASPIKLNAPASKTYVDNTDFKAPTEVVPIVKEKSVNISEDDFERAKQVKPLVDNAERKSDFDEVDFELATQVLPAAPKKLKTSASKTYVDNTGFKALTEVVPIAKETPVNVLKGDFEGAKQVKPLVDDEERKSDFDEVDFEVATQVVPVKLNIPTSKTDDVDFKAPLQVVTIAKEKVKNSENNTDLDRVDFEAATQALPTIGIKFKSNKDTYDVDDVDFEACTQVKPNTSKILNNLSNEMNITVEESTKEINWDLKVKTPDNEVSFDDTDFLAATQPTHVSEASLIKLANGTKNYFKGKIMNSDNKNDFDDVDFGATTQVMHITPLKNKTGFDDVDFEACTQVESTVNRCQDDILHLNENCPSKSDASEVQIFDSVTNDPKCTLNIRNDDDSTDCEDEVLLSSSLAVKNVTESVNEKGHLPSPPEDIESYANSNIHVNLIENEEVAYMLPTQIDSQSMCFSQNQSNIFTVTHPDKHGDKNKLPFTVAANSDSSTELPSTPEFERQLAEAEVAFNENQKKKRIPKRSHPNRSELEFSTLGTKRRRKMTWKMNELMNLNSNSSESFCNTSDDSTSTPSRSVKLRVRPSIRNCNNASPLPNVSGTETSNKYNTRWSMKKRESSEITPKLRETPNLRRKRARVIDSDSGNENENHENYLFCVAFAVNPSSNFRSTIQSLGGTIVEVNEANVFICDKFRRTIKVMSALSKGIQMVTSKWILECKRYHRWLDTSNYILNDEGAEKKWKFTLKESLKKAAASKLLSGYTVFTTPNVSPRPSEISKLIESCGGTNIAEIPRIWPPKSFVISSRSDVRQWPRVPSYVKIVEVQFVINSIIHQKLDFTQLILK